MVVGWGMWGPLGPFNYISPGLQIGYNNNEGIFYGFQISYGFKEPDFLKDNIEIRFLLIPSICYGFKRYYKKYNEQYIDFQSTFFFNKIFIDEIELPIGIGVGKNFSKNNSNIRFKGFTWYWSSFTVDYELKKNSVNYSLIPILPILLNINN